MDKSTRKSDFHPSIRALLRRGRHVKREFCVCSNSKDQLGDLNQKLIIAINTLVGSKLGDNLVTSHQVDHMSTERLFQLNLLKRTKSIL